MLFFLPLYPSFFLNLRLQKGCYSYRKMMFPNFSSYIFTIFQSRGVVCTGQADSKINIDFHEIQKLKRKRKAN